MLFKTAIAALTAMAALVLAPAAHALTTLSGVTWTGTATGITVTATVSDAATLGACGGWGYKLGFAPAGATYSYFVTQDGATGDIIRTDTEGIIGHATVSSGGQLLTIDLPTAVIGRPTDLAWQLDSYNLGDGVTAPCEALWYTFRSQGGQALVSYPAAAPTNRGKHRGGGGRTAAPTTLRGRTTWSALKLHYR